MKVQITLEKKDFKSFKKSYVETAKKIVKGLNKLDKKHQTCWNLEEIDCYDCPVYEDNVKDCICNLYNTSNFTCTDAVKQFLKLAEGKNK